MFRKILIANRGEIASRVIQTCQRLGIKTVAIYSEADESLPYLQMADEAFLVGGPQVKDSYLNIDNIMSVAKQSQVEAIHPGYGFMSESDEFVERCEKEGIVFIGPSAPIMKQMGNKIEARHRMKAAGVPVIPGTNKLKNLDDAYMMAKEIGYPIMVKAAAGGGGIGMQIVSDETALEKAFTSNQARATSYFGNDAIYIEKLFDNARHVEIQVIADHFGNAVHLFERECSIQRRNQKVLEEAPSPFISESTRKKMGEIAIKAVKQLGYTNAGTIEFLVDGDENFYFLEMNTRIQVEHAITEKITGIDIVEMQLIIAYGGKLPISQSDINRHGHAIEARIYAEDPKTFFPSPGKITTYVAPEGKGIRIDATVTEGVTVTPFYDPMISKLVVHSDTRENAIGKLKTALSSYKIEGIKTNIPLLLKLIEHEQFKLGNTTTKFIEKFF